MSGLSGVGNTNNSSTGTNSTGTLGNIPPVSFPGISSGIDYNAIIQKLTSLTLAQNQPLQQQSTQLTKANTELIKIQGLIANVQQSLTAMADPTLFSAFSATSSNTAVATAAQISGQTPTAGTTTILAQTLATSTQITSDPAANKIVNTGVSLATAGFQITPKNGSGSTGKLTINGQTLSYDVGTDTVTSIVAKINALVGVTAAFAGDKLTITSTSGPLSLGSASDSGNLLQIFKLDVAQITGGGTTITSAATVGGLNPSSNLSTANLTTPLNGGNTFTINGVAFSINPATQSLNDMINSINSSTAGVIASWDAINGHVVLVAKATGPQSIVLGAPGDSSNFLQAVGLTTGGATTLVGQQASVKYQTPSGGTTTVFSSSNQVTTVIPGVTLTLLQSTATPYTVTVARNNTNLETAIGNFVTTYNAAIDEINSAIAAPVVQTAGPGTAAQPGQTSSAQVLPGGVLFGDLSVQGLKDQLVSLVSGLVQNGSTSYNSFASVGLQLDNSVGVVTSTSTSGNNNSNSSSNNSQSSNGLQTQTFDGTTGKLVPLNTSTFEAALAANPTAVQAIFSGANSASISAQLGNYLTFVTGTPTQLGPNGSFAGTAPDVSLIQSIENANSSQIDSINQQIALINDIATQQANQLRQEFVASETMIAQLQQEQASLAGFLNASNNGH